MTAYILTKSEAAADQLDWAIRLFLDHDAFVPAITLAGAAEEIVGAPLSDQSAFVQLKKVFANELSLSEKDVGQLHLNRAKNWLKHWKGHRDSETETVELKNEAIHYIVRGITNFVAFDGSVPSEAPRFLAWLSKNWDPEHGA